MRKAYLFAALTALSLSAGALSPAAIAANLGGQGGVAGRGGDGGGGAGGGGPTGQGGPSQSNSNFNNGSAYYVIPPDCRRTNTCKPPIVIVRKAPEIPPTKCQLERLVQIGNGPFGEPIYQFKRDCDRLYVQ